MAQDRQAKRLEFHAILESLPGVKEVYFQRPPSNQMVYDCIVYSSRPTYEYANNKKYINGTAYTVIFIHRDPDSETVNEILKLPYASYDRNYISEGLYHDVFTIYHI